MRFIFNKKSEEHNSSQRIIDSKNYTKTKGSKLPKTIKDKIDHIYVDLTKDLTIDTMINFMLILDTDMERYEGIINYRPNKQPGAHEQHRFEGDLVLTDKEIKDYQAVEEKLKV